MRKIVLASKSVDRKEILTRAKVPFDVLVTNVDEDIYKREITDPVELIRKLAEIKALTAKKTLKDNNQNAIVIAADTIVELDGLIIGKAKDEKQAFQILKKLMGKTHNLLTGIAITETTSSKIVIDHDITAVKFLNLSDDEIWGYIKSFEWRGRAGAYSIREKASLFIESIEGSSTNVIGLPMQKIFSHLNTKFNLNLLNME